VAPISRIDAARSARLTEQRKSSPSVVGVLMGLSVPSVGKQLRVGVDWLRRARRPGFTFLSTLQEGRPIIPVLM
jgi:hypothetical protein